MGKIVVSDNVSLDGVIQDPAGDEGFRLGGWVGLIEDRQGINKLTLDEAVFLPWHGWDLSNPLIRPASDSRHAARFMRVL